MDIAAVNGGYSHFKWRYKKRRGIFAAVRGPARDMILADRVDGIVLQDREERAWFVGELALQHSGRMLSRPEGREWVKTAAYEMYWQAALSEMSAACRPVELKVVTGLPIDYYGEQRVLLDNLLAKEHQFLRGGRGRQTFRIAEVQILPELMGSLFCCTIDAKGQEYDNLASQGRVGIVDAGGHNVNFMGVDAMVPKRDESRTTDAGCWQAVNLVREAVDGKYPGLNLHDHEVVQAMITRRVKWRRQRYDIGRIVDDAVVPLAESIAGVISQLWNGASRFDMVLLTGGGALLIEPYVRALFKEGYPADFVQVFGSTEVGLLPELKDLIGDVDPVYGNVEGMYRYGLNFWL